MKPEILYIFQLEIERQCKFALMAAQDLNQAQQALNLDMDRLWYSVQAFLVAVGNISKILWPSKPCYSERGGYLREALGVAEDSPLEPRVFRNHFEHFDERLEKWGLSAERGNFVDSNVGPLDAISNFKPQDCLRHFDPVNVAITFRGDMYRLQPVINAVRDISAKAAQVTLPLWRVTP